MHIPSAEGETRRSSKFIFLEVGQEQIFWERLVEFKKLTEMRKGFCMSLRGNRKFLPLGGPVPRGRVRAGRGREPCRSHPGGWKERREATRVPACAGRPLKAGCGFREAVCLYGKESS